MLEEVAKGFRRKGFEVLVEWNFRVEGGALRKPDLVVFKRDVNCCIVDITITSDMYEDPDEPHLQKAAYYRQHLEIWEGAAQLSGVQPTFSAVAISWRGVFAPLSATHLKSMGWTNSELLLLSAITVEQGAVIHRIKHKSRGGGELGL